MADKAISFASLLKKNLYKNRDILYDQKPPGSFLHRIDERNELVVELMPILLNSSFSYIFAYGTPGTGKTGLIMEVMEELQGTAKKEGVGLSVVYINCSENRTETTILLDILGKINPEKEYPAMGWNKTQATKEFISVVKEMKQHVIIVLDEVDYALKESGDDILMKLSRINERAGKTVSSVIISNDVKVADYIKPRTMSRFGRVKVIFPPYNADELYDILKDRAGHAFKAGVVSDVILKKIGEIEGSRGGDARKALELLDACAKVTISKGSDKISLEYVESAEKSLEKDQIIKVLTSLTRHQKILYLAILKGDDKKKAGTGVFSQYKKDCKSYNETPLSERRIRTFLVEFSELGLIESEVGWLKDLKKKNRKITITIGSSVKNKVRKLLRDSI